MRIDITVTFRGIVAESPNGAAMEAWREVGSDDLLQAQLSRVGIANFGDFRQACRIAKECNGTYTVTIP